MSDQLTLTPRSRTNTHAKSHFEGILVRERLANVSGPDVRCGARGPRPERRVDTGRRRRLSWPGRERAHLLLSRPGMTCPGAWAPGAGPAGC